VHIVGFYYKNICRSHWSFVIEPCCVLCEVGCGAEEIVVNRALYIEN
jgi:hypothetical protein